MRFFLSITILILAGFIIFWQPGSSILFWQENFLNDNSLKNGTHNGANEGAVISPSKMNQASVAEENNLQYGDSADDIIEEFVPNPEAVASMRKARIEGDPRAPKLGEYHERDVPTTQELGDHEQYLEYERRQKKRVYRAYVEASKVKTTQLRSMIEQGKAEGVSAEEIAFAEEKIRGIEEMAATLQLDHPDIMEDSYQPPADWLIENLGKDDDSIETNESKANTDQ